MKIFLAGTFGEEKNIETIKRSKYVLESFYYVKPWQLEIIKSSEAFMLDSGAFTFMQGKNKRIDWDDYIEKYSQFINDHHIELFFELDIDSVVGHERVIQLRKKLERMTNRQPIPVWHSNRGADEFIKSCEEYPYVALGGIVGQEWKPSHEKYMTWFIKQAHKRGSKIHGLGYTKVGNLPKYHFDSVDSTRWNCARFGRIEYFDGKTIRPIDKRRQGKRVATKSDANMFTFQEWVKFQQWAENNL